MKSKARVAVGIIGGGLSLFGALWLYMVATWGMAPAGTVDDHVTMAFASALFAVGVGFILTGIAGMKLSRAAAVAIAACVISLPVMQFMGFNSITVGTDIRVIECHDNYSGNDRLTRLAETENISISRIDELVDAQCAKYQDSLSARGELPHPISAAEVKQFARSVPADEKCEEKYALNNGAGKAVSSSNTPITTEGGLGGRISALCIKLNDAGKLHANGTFVDSRDAKRVADMRKQAVTNEG